MIDLESICKVSYTRSTLVCMGDNDDFMTEVYEFL
jgi:hypothetical protein